MTKETDPAHLEWLVTRRSEIQADLLDIYKLTVSCRDEFSKNLAALGFSHLMVGAGFSLWRAVFLGNVTLSQDIVAGKAEEFLLTLIEDNAIGYPQDRRMQEWTFGYYVNNAAFRIGEMSRRSGEFSVLLQSSSIDFVSWQIVATKLPKPLLDNCQKALRLAITHAQDIFAKLPHAPQ
jgi:hypothetical protein